MNPYPGKNSVLVMDNAKIHHDEHMINIIESVGCKVLFLPPYSPDFNLIELAFSVIKSWIKRNKDFIEICPDPEFAIIVVCSQITPIIAKSFYEKSIYL
jgi:transposase